MNCPKCSQKPSKVIDSRDTTTRFNAIRRRRECLSCQHRWTTYETAVVDEPPPTPKMIRDEVRQEAIQLVRTVLDEARVNT